MFQVGDYVVRRELPEDRVWPFGFEVCQITRVVPVPGGNALLQLDIDGGADYWGANYFEAASSPVAVTGEALHEVFDALFKHLHVEAHPESAAKLESSRVQAPDLLEAAYKHMSDRAATYDSPEGERSMGKTVEAFNAITGHKLTEEQGWMFMTLLKMVRSTQGDFKSDNYEDAVAYEALRGEAAHRARG